MQKSEAVNVVIIDDDDSYYNILKPKFAKSNIDLIWARGGQDGICIVEKKKPKLVITDVVMPECNGFEIIRILKSKPETADTLFVILSDWGETRLVYDSEFLDSLGIDRYLIKSNHTPTEVFKEVKNILGK